MSKIFKDKKKHNNKPQLPSGEGAPKDLEAVEAKGIPSGHYEPETTVEGKLGEQFETVIKAYKNKIREYEEYLSKLSRDAAIAEMSGLFGEQVDFSDLYTLYEKSGNTRGGLNREEFEEFIAFINVFNSMVSERTSYIVMGNNPVYLENIPFDNRLKCLLTPKSITIDVYDARMHDFKLRDENIKCNADLMRWKLLQERFFYNWKNRYVDETNSLKDVMENATLSQISKRCFMGEGTALEASNYFRVNSGEIYQMPVKVNFKFWDTISDTLDYEEAIYNVYHDLFLRIVKG